MWLGRALGSAILVSRRYMKYLVTETSHPAKSPALERPFRWFESETDLPTFEKLNDSWNAHPSVPQPDFTASSSNLVVRFVANRVVYPERADSDCVLLFFQSCSRYRITMVNDHGWFSGQCRFSGLAPEWGNFYEVHGNTWDTRDTTEWIDLAGAGSRHFHFYFRDETLEVKAQDWRMGPIPD